MVDVRREEVDVMLCLRGSPPFGRNKRCGSYIGRLEVSLNGGVEDSGFARRASFIRDLNP